MLYQTAEVRDRRDLDDTVGLMTALKRRQKRRKRD